MNPIRSLPGHPLAIILLLTSLAVLASGCSDDDPAGPGAVIETVEETVELLLTARGSEDVPLGSDADGVTTVEVGEEFTLELSYIDHREETERLGAFQVYIDLLADQADVLRPVVGETLRLVVGEEILAADPSGSISFGLEGSLDSYSTTGAAFIADPEGELIAALSQFGYVLAEDYTLKRWDNGGADIGLQITWNNARHGNEDMPDLSMVPDFPESVPTQIVEFSPFGPDGVTVNSAALRFNVDTRSRGFNGNQEFYANLVDAEYAPATGFTRVGGVGPAVVGGIPEASDDGSIPQPFDAFSLRVVVVAPVAGLTITATPSSRGDAVLMYGQEAAVALEYIRMDGDHMLKLDAVLP